MVTHKIITYTQKLFVSTQKEEKCNERDNLAKIELFFQAQSSV